MVVSYAGKLKGDNGMTAAKKTLAAVLTHTLAPLVALALLVALVLFSGTRFDFSSAANTAPLANSATLHGGPCPCNLNG
jgi:hypothetical protein